MPNSEAWRDNKSWQATGITSGARYVHWFLAGFALLWNLFTLPIVWYSGDILRQTETKPAALLVFIFPLIGLVLIVAASRALLQWRRFGPTPLMLDPFPGSIGGQVGGTIDTRIPFVAGQRFDVSLACLHSRVTGTGKNRSRSESAKWQTDGVCHVQRGAQGVRLSFRFEIPDNLPASDYPTGSSYHLWRLIVCCELDGPDFDRRYNIPVLPGVRTSSISQGTESHHATVDSAMEGVESIAAIETVPGGIGVYFPALQRPAQGVLSLAFGLVFFAVGYYVGTQGATPVIALAFMNVGGLVAAWGTYYLGKSLRVSVTRDGVRTRRFLFSLPITSRQLSRSDFESFTVDHAATMQSGSKTTVYYRVYANAQDGKRFAVAERLGSRAEAELLRDTYATYLAAE